MWVCVCVCACCVGQALIIDRATSTDSPLHRGFFCTKCERVWVCVSAVTSDINCIRKTGSFVNTSGFFPDVPKEHIYINVTNFA